MLFFSINNRKQNSLVQIRKRNEWLFDNPVKPTHYAIFVFSKLPDFVRLLSGLFEVDQWSASWKIIVFQRPTRLHKQLETQIVIETKGRVLCRPGIGFQTSSHTLSPFCVQPWNLPVNKNVLWFDTLCVHCSKPTKRCCTGYCCRTKPFYFWRHIRYFFLKQKLIYK